ncbi:cysteine desulfurase family protein [Rhodopila sp.]|uniref:cysteine desulfurase family protein n=1 Tax=Rhodopila sp. TaxID=2480087 RepID=UPI003D140C20
MHYLDANATQPMRPEAKAAVVATLDMTGNPASVHQAGRAVRRHLEAARETLAERFGGRAQDVVFTSGGTEADALALHTFSPNRRVLISAIEHDAVRVAALDPIVLPVGADGVVDLDVLETVLRDDVPSLVCLMLANNETGVVQPVAQAAAICRQHGALLHVDAVQAVGRMEVNLLAAGAHSLAISSHKLGGPAGIGALLMAQDAPFTAPLIAGGGQERGRRGGTPSVALAAGFAAAASATDNWAWLAELRDQAEAAAVASGAVVCGDATNRLPNTTCLALPGVRADAQVIALDLEGVAVSAGAACSSGKVATSHVLRAMGLGPLASEAIRVSLPWNATRANINAFAAAYPRVAARLRSALVPRAA